MGQNWLVYKTIDIIVNRVRLNFILSYEMTRESFSVFGLKTACEVCMYTAYI